VSKGQKASKRFFSFSGDIELNPGPENFTICIFNIRPNLHSLHSAALCDLINSHNPDLFRFTETWIKPTITSTALVNCTSPHYFFSSTPDFSKTSSSRAGTGFFILEPFSQLSILLCLISLFFE